MSGSEFLAHLSRTAPSHQEMEEYGLEEEEIEMILRCFKARPRALAPGGRAPDNEIERMMMENDCSTVEVGMVRFLEWPVEHEDGMQIAFCEADLVVIRKDGGVVMHDHAATFPALNCAADPERFLDGLAMFAEIVQSKAGWKGRSVQAAERCAERAGGPGYAPFFGMLCGFVG